MRGFPLFNYYERYIMRVKIFLNNKGEPTKFEDEINEWLENKIYKIKEIQYSTSYDEGLDEYLLSALILYEG